MKLMYGLSNDNRFIRIDLVYYPKPPTRQYIYPREGWHLLARSGRLDYKGQAFQDASFQRQFVSLDYEEALSLIENSFSRVEKMYYDLFSKMLKENKYYMNFKTIVNYKKEKQDEHEVLRIS